MLRRSEKDGMSIALQAQVDRLEKRVEDMQRTIHEQDRAILKILMRVDELERNAARKPGPKPKDSNG